MGHFERGRRETEASCHLERQCPVMRSGAGPVPATAQPAVSPAQHRLHLSLGQLIPDCILICTNTSHALSHTPLPPAAMQGLLLTCPSGSSYITVGTFAFSSGSKGLSLTRQIVSLMSAAMASTAQVR